MKTQREILDAASDFSTTSEVLIELAATSDIAIRRALARNPNTPEVLLQTLWEAHPDCILDNPILALWEFTRGCSAAELIGDRLLLGLFNHLRSTNADLPSHLFTPASLRGMVRRGVSRNDPEVFAFAPFEENADWRVSMLENPTRRGLFAFFEEHAADAVWMRFATDPDPKVRLAFAALLRSGPFDAEPRRTVLAEAARALFRDGRRETHAHLANCRLLPPDLVDSLSASPEVETREALSRCVNATIPALERLAADPELPVRLALARNCILPEIHKILLRDPAADVRRLLAQNHSVSAAVLALFNPRDIPDVIRAVFLARHADSTLRARLVRQADPVIQNVVPQMGSSYTPAFHRDNKDNLTPETLSRIAESTRIRRSLLEELARDPLPQIRLGVARRLRNSYNRGPSPANLALLKALAADPHPSVRLQICTDPRLDKESTAALFRDPDPAVREKCVQAVLDALQAGLTSRNLSSYRYIYETKADLITARARDPAPSVRLAIAHASEAPPAAKGLLFDDPEPCVRDAFRLQSHWPYGVLLDLEKRLGSKAKTLKLRHGVTTPAADALRILAKSPNPFERLLTAHCRRTPKADLKLLANDPYPAIREAACSRSA